MKSCQRWMTFARHGNMKKLCVETAIARNPDPERSAEAALQARDMALAIEPTPNYRNTPDGPNETPVAFRAAWKLNDRQHSIALLLECQLAPKTGCRDGITPVGTAARGTVFGSPSRGTS